MVGPVIFCCHDVESAFRTTVELNGGEITAGGRTYGFDEVLNLQDVGLQVLLASGWCPDCVTVRGWVAHSAIPPRTDAESPMVFGSPQAMRWLG